MGAIHEVQIIDGDCKSYHGVIDFTQKTLNGKFYVHFRGHKVPTHKERFVKATGCEHTVDGIWVNLNQVKFIPDEESTWLKHEVQPTH